MLRLLDNCVRAMQLLDVRMSGLENKSRRAAEENAREKAESRADIATLRTRTKLTDRNLDQMQVRMGAIEAAANQSQATHSGELTAARADVEQWRLRAESATARMAAMEDRLTKTETGLERRLLDTETALVEAQAQVSVMEQRASTSDASADAMHHRLSDALAAVADQRLRIACLQAKLGTRAETTRYAGAIEAMSEPDTTAVDAVIDLADLAEERLVSAA